ncbi:MAG: hypothetical protein R2839_12475 [Thermomicrobiales bacterium]
MAGSPASTDHSTSIGPSPVLAMRHVSRRFGATQALDDVSIDLFSGEIHALLVKTAPANRP